MASTSFDTRELFVALLTLRKNDILENGCRYDRHPYRAPNLTAFQPTYARPRTFVVFAGFKQIREVFKRAMLNRELASWIRGKLFSEGPTKEVCDVRDTVIRMLHDALREFVSEPFNEDRTGDTIVAVNLSDMVHRDTPFTDRIFEFKLVDTVRLSDDVPVLRLTLNDAFRIRDDMSWEFAYDFVPVINADEEVVDAKQLTDVDTEAFFVICLQSFFSLSTKQSIVREFYTRKDDERFRTNRRRFKRELENTIANNEGLIEDMLEPGAAEIEWLPEPNVRVTAFVMLSHPRLGVGSLWHRLPDDVMQRIARLCLNHIY